jgi:hypothetical protein
MTILTVSADRSLGSVLERIVESRPEWVVLVRTMSDRADVYYYAFRPYEIEALGTGNPALRALAISEVMDLHEWMSSAMARVQRMTSQGGQKGVAAGRVVELDAAGRISAVREPQLKEAGHGGGTTSALPPNLGSFRGGGASTGGGQRVVGTRAGSYPPTSPAAETEVTISAQTKAEIQVGANELVDFRIEIASEAMPLSVAKTAVAKTDVPIVVSLSVENDAIEIVQEQERTVDPPASKQPRTGYFLIKGVRTGVSRLAVRFRQGGSDLGVIGLALEVVDQAVMPSLALGKASAAPRDPDEDDKLALLVEQRTEGGEVFYQYTLHSEALGLPYRKLRSNALLDRGGGPAAAPLAFVERIYDRVTQELKSFDDLNELQREARALGVNLCQELLDKAVTKELWPLRARIKVIQIVSWEPYIPWELVRLHDPDTGEIDDRFLAEYGMVRTLADEMPLRELPMVRWGYLGATFPMGTYPQVGAELDYFTGTSCESLNGRGIKPEAISATRDAFYDVLAKDEFDVLHISCHAESAHQSIERASLIISDETPPGASQARPVEVDTITVQAEARLKGRHPLVFLNGCETGRVGAVLTSWGGWPNVFLRAGAAAFVGSAWAVRDKPAAKFSTVFYNALLDGRTLAEAATEARSAAKQMGDASWLAFKVYGHPRARRAVRDDSKQRYK